MMLTLTTHVPDERLVALAVDAQATTREAAHLARCGTCADAQARLAGLVRNVSAVAAGEADAAFPPARLAAQRARILSRVAQVSQPAAVLEFPVPAATPARRAVRRRWLGAAASAAAGLLLGALADQTLIGPAAPVAPSLAAPALADAVTEAPAAVIVPAAVTISDDDLLLQMEAAGRRPQPATLRSLDALTPRAADLISLR
jgi:hypothetical protein